MFRHTLKLRGFNLKNIMQPSSPCCSRFRQLNCVQHPLSHIPMLTIARHRGAVKPHSTERPAALRYVSFCIKHAIIHKATKRRSPLRRPNQEISFMAPWLSLFPVVCRQNQPDPAELLLRMPLGVRVRKSEQIFCCQAC